MPQARAAAAQNHRAQGEGNFRVFPMNVLHIVCAGTQAAAMAINQRARAVTRKPPAISRDHARTNAPIASAGAGTVGGTKPVESGKGGGQRSCPGCKACMAP